ncbi:hypothetical protein ACFE04_016692 [Oxalis oulophora]
MSSCCGGGGGGAAAAEVFLVKMSLNCFNGRLPASFKLRKGKETGFNGSNYVRKWRRKFLLFWILVIVGSLLSVYFSSFNGGTGIFCSKRQEDSVGFRQGEAQMLVQHFNVTQQQLHDMASLFSESDQVSSLKCTKEPGDITLPNHGITCSIKVLCSEVKEIRKHHKWITEGVGLVGQCPAQHEELPGKIDLPLLKDETVQFGSQSTISTTYNVVGQVKDCSKDKCKIFSYCLIRYGWWVLLAVVVSFKISGFRFSPWKNENLKLVNFWPVTGDQQLQPLEHQLILQQKQLSQAQGSKSAGKWRKKLLAVFVFSGIITSIWLFWHLDNQIKLKRRETLTNMCDERARMLQDQFNVSMNHVNALAILVSTFHHGKNPPAIDQKTFSEYTDRTSFERPLTSGVSYALKVLHLERETFEKQHGWAIKKMESEDQTLGQNCVPENLDPAPVQDEYAPVIFSQDTVSHIVSIDMMSGKEDRENILRARASGKGVLTSPFKLLKSNHLGVVLTFAVYSSALPPNATPKQRVEATVGYLGASYDVPSLVDKLLHQLASKQTIVVNVYDTTNQVSPITMYGSEDIIDTGLLHVSSLDFGDPMRKHEMHCRFKHSPALPWSAINASLGVFVITLLLGHIFHAAISRIAKVEEGYRNMMELKVRAEAADVAKSRFLATVSHEIRTPMFGVLGMLQMLMDTDLDATQLDYAQTAHLSGKDLISLINEVLDQAKIESGRLELEAVSFDPRGVLDNILSLFSGRANEKKIQVPEVVIGDPGRFRQIITNLVGNSIKFTNDGGHLFISVHLADEAKNPCDVEDEVLRQGLTVLQDKSSISGHPVVNRWKSWENFKDLNSTDTIGESENIRLLVTVEDTGVGIPPDAQSRIFTPFMQADSSTSRTYGGTGIGLSISKCLVALMGGEIGFVSEQGTGSTFSFTVCLKKGERQQSEPTIPEFQGLRALVVDNRSMRAEVTRYHLQRLGISVEITSDLDLSKACSTSACANWAMVLVDRDVWDEETGSKIHNLLRNTQKIDSLEILTSPPRTILLATSTSPTERSELKSAGVDNILVKPLKLSSLETCLQETLGNGRKKKINRNKPTTLGNLLKGKKILVVDDNKVNRRVAEAAIKKYGATVTCVESGKIAIQMLKPPHSFDACFMDLQMPEMDGFEATRRIRHMESEVNERLKSGEASSEMFNNVTCWHLPVLAMTADVTQASNEECTKCGMDDYVSKPFEEDQLHSALARENGYCKHDGYLAIDAKNDQNC